MHQSQEIILLDEQKRKALAIKSALTSRVNADKFMVLDQFGFDEIKTKKMKEVLDNLKVTRALIVLDKKDDNVALSQETFQT